MSKPIDMTNQTYGDWIVLGIDYDYKKEHNLKSKDVYWKCQCSCGKIKKC